MGVEVLSEALAPDELADLLSVVDPLMDWVNVTVGVRTTYVRDMATTRPPLLDELARVRPAVRGALLVSHAFRRPEWELRSETLFHRASVYLLVRRPRGR